MGPISAWPGLAQHPALVLVLPSHMPFLNIFPGASVAISNINKTMSFFSNPAPTSFLGSLSVLLLHPFAHFKQCPPPLQLPSAPEPLGGSCPPGPSLVGSPAVPWILQELVFLVILWPPHLSAPPELSTPSVIFSSLLPSPLVSTLLINLHTWHQMSPKLDQEFHENRGPLLSGSLLYPQGLERDLRVVTK